MNSDPLFNMCEKLSAYDLKPYLTLAILLQFRKAPEGTPRKVEAQKQFFEAMSHRMHIDQSIKLTGKLLFGIEKGSEILNTVRPAGQPLVDDWDCLKSLVKLLIISPFSFFSSCL